MTTVLLVCGAAALLPGREEPEPAAREVAGPPVAAVDAMEA